MNDTFKEIRRPAVAGTFYPGNAGDLTKTIASYFSDVEKTPLSGPVMALFAPHAGYLYSGKTAARAYKLLDGEQFDSVVVISPSHTVFFKGAAVYDGDGYQTPLGVIEIDKELSKRIGSINPLVHPSKMGHATGSSRGEHALELVHDVAGVLDEELLSDAQQDVPAALTPGDRDAQHGRGP